MKRQLIDSKQLNVEEKKGRHKKHVVVSRNYREHVPKLFKEEISDLFSTTTKSNTQSKLSISHFEYTPFSRTFYGPKYEDNGDVVQRSILGDP